MKKLVITFTDEQYDELQALATLCHTDMTGVMVKAVSLQNFLMRYSAPGDALLLKRGNSIQKLILSE